MERVTQAMPTPSLAWKPSSFLASQPHLSVGAARTAWWSAWCKGGVESPVRGMSRLVPYPSNTFCCLVPNELAASPPCTTMLGLSSFLGARSDAGGAGWDARTPCVAALSVSVASFIVLALTRTYVALRTEFLCMEEIL